MVNPLAGILLGARYRLIEHIDPGDTGGVGVVWDARDEQLNLPVAIKELRLPSGASDELRAQALHQARTEARHAGHLTHPGIVAVYDVVYEYDTVWIVMQRITGRSLAAAIAAGGPWDPVKVAKLGTQLVEALAASHAAGVSHGDVQPSNVLVTDFGGVFLTNFSMTPIGASGPTADLYDLATTLYYAAQGHWPFDNGQQAPATTKPQTAVTHNEQLTAVIDALLARDPARRPSLAQVGERLAAIGDPAQAAPAARRPRRSSGATHSPDPADTPPRRSRRRLLAVVIAVLVLSGAGAAIANLRSPDPDASSPGASADTSTASASPAALDTLAPQQPVNLTVSGRTLDAITLVWDPAIDDVGVTGYRVLRDGAEVGVTLIPDYTDTGLALDTVYKYTVLAVDGAGNISPASAAVSGRTLKVPDTTKPTAPRSPRVTGRSTTSIVLLWTASKDDVGVSRYEVRRDGKPVGTVTGTKYTDTGLAPNSSHTYVVRAVDAAGNISDPSKPVTAVTLTAPDTAPPGLPGSLHTTSTGTTTIGLAWTAATDTIGVTGYLVYRNGSLVATVDNPAYTDTGLAPGTSYTYQVRATDGAGNLSDAASLSASTTSPQVTGITVAASIGGAPDCTVTVTATVSVSAGPVTVSLQSDIAGQNGASSVSFPGTGPQSQTVTVGTGAGAGADNGTAQVSSTAPNTVSGSKSWTAQANCKPGFSVSAATASVGDCGSPVIAGGVKVSTLNNASPEQYTVAMRVDGATVVSTSATIAPNSANTVRLTSPDPWPNGTYAVTYLVTPSGGGSEASGEVTVEVNC